MRRGAHVSGADDIVPIIPMYLRRVVFENVYIFFRVKILGTKTFSYFSVITYYNYLLCSIGL